MKVIIIHNSNFGNGIKVAETIANNFQDAEVIIKHNKDIKPIEIISENPDVLVIGTAIRIFHVSWESRRWINKLAKLLKKEDKKIAYGACYLTHARELEKIRKSTEKYFENVKSKQMFDEFYPKLIYAQVEDVEGPLKSGVLEKIGQISREFGKQPVIP